MILLPTESFTEELVAIDTAWLGKKKRFLLFAFCCCLVICKEESQHPSEISGQNLVFFASFCHLHLKY